MGSLAPARVEPMQKKIRPTMGGKAPKRVLEEGAYEEAQEIPARDSGPLLDL